MGTNYYWRHNACGTCDRYDEWHICKSRVSFRGRFEAPEWDEDTCSYGPQRPVVVSWQEWKALLRGGGEVWDEHGVRLAAAAFIADVESTSRAARRRQYDWCVAHPERVQNVDVVGDRGTWLDADGFSFYGGEFS